MKSALNKLRICYYWIDWRRFVWLLAATTIIHILFTVFYDSTLGVDGGIYQRVAGNIIESGSVTACGAFEGAYWPPLFCYYLAGFWALFGQLDWLFYLLNIAISIGIALLSISYLRRLFEERVVYWAVLFFYNSMIVYYFSMFYKYELLAGLFLAASFVMIITAVPTKYRSFLAGLFLGLATLTTARLIVMLPALWYYSFQAVEYRVQKRQLVHGALILLGVVVIIAPWTMRNAYCLERFIPISSNGGINFYMGFNEHATGGYKFKREFPEPYNQFDRTESAAFYRGGFDYIRSHPVHSITLMIRKLNLLWRVHYFDMSLFYPFFYIGIFLLVRWK